MVRLSTKLDDLSATVRTPAQPAAAQAPATQQAAAVLPSDLFNEAKGLLDKQSHAAAATGFKVVYFQISYQ